MALSKIDVANMLTGTAPVANGGTGVTTAAALANTGNLVLLSTQNASNDASLSFDSSVITDTYSYYRMVYVTFIPSVDGVNARIHVSSDNGSSYATSGYGRTQFYASRDDANDSDLHYKTGEVSNGLFLGGQFSLGGLNRENASGFVDMFSLRTVKGKSFIFQSSYESNGGHGIYNGGQFYFDDASIINNIKISCSSGNIESGTFSLYGVKI